MSPELVCPPLLSALVCVLFCVTVIVSRPREPPQLGGGAVVLPQVVEAHLQGIDQLGQAVAGGAAAGAAGRGALALAGRLVVVDDAEEGRSEVRPGAAQVQAHEGELEGLAGGGGGGAVGKRHG